MSNRRLGLRQVEKAAWEVAVERFNEVSKAFLGWTRRQWGCFLRRMGWA